MKVSLIAGIASAVLLATASHAQTAPDGVIDLGIPDGTGAPTEAVYTYSLGAGSDSGVITPPAGVPVTVLGTQTTVSFRGVGQVSLFRVSDNFLEWTGLESTSGSAITDSYNSAHGTHILWLDFAHQVDIEVNDANSFFIHNGSGATRTGQVTLIW